MKILFVNLEVKEEFVEEFAEFTRKNHEGSVKEAGNIRFDALRDKDDPCRFSLYEIWQDDAALDVHKTTEHYKNWAKACETMLKSPRTRRIFDAVGITDVTRGEIEIS